MLKFQWLLFSGAFVCNSVLFLQAEGPTSIMSELASAKDIVELSSHFTTMMRSSEPGNVQYSMLSTNDPTAALLCAWTRTGASHDRNIRLPEAAVSRFLGFLEGRTRVNVPLWWDEWLRHNYQESVSSFGRIYQRPAPIVRWRRMAESLVVSLSSSSMREIVVSVPVLRPNYHTAVSICGENLFVADYADTVEPYRLMAFDCKTCSDLWAAEIWGARPVFGNAGGHTVSMECSESQVVVFGAGPAGNYIEAFDISTGRCRIRFATSTFCK